MDSESIIRIVKLATGVFFALMILSGALWGMKRKIFKSAVRTATIIVAIPIAILILSIIKKTSLFEKLSSSLPISDSETDFDVESVAGNVEILAKALISPILFSAIFMITYKLLFFVYLIIKIIFAKKVKSDSVSKGVSRLVGALISAVGSLIVFFCAFCPLNGYVGCLSRAGWIFREHRRKRNRNRGLQLCVGIKGRVCL